MQISSLNNRQKIYDKNVRKTTQASSFVNNSIINFRGKDETSFSNGIVGKMQAVLAFLKLKLNYSTKISIEIAQEKYPVAFEELSRYTYINKKGVEARIFKDTEIVELSPIYELDKGIINAFIQEDKANKTKSLRFNLSEVSQIGSLLKEKPNVMNILLNAREKNENGEETYRYSSYAEMKPFFDAFRDEDFDILDTMVNYKDRTLATHKAYLHNYEILSLAPIISKCKKEVYDLLFRTVRGKNDTRENRLSIMGVLDIAPLMHEDKEKLEYLLKARIYDRSNNKFRLLKENEIVSFAKNGSLEAIKILIKAMKNREEIEPSEPLLKAMSNNPQVALELYKKQGNMSFNYSVDDLPILVKIYPKHEKEITELANMDIGHGDKVSRMSIEDISNVLVAYVEYPEEFKKVINDVYHEIDGSNIPIYKNLEVLYDRCMRERMRKSKRETNMFF